MQNQPLADRIRPTSFDDLVGQKHLFGPNGTIRRMIRQGHFTNMIFYGPPGTGKTTAANVIAAQSGMTLCRLNATTASTADIHDVIAKTETLFGSDGILLYLDEIQYFNKKQQQTLLETLEDGRITLIASTTENPHLYVYNAILSRSAVFPFYAVDPDEIERALRRGCDLLTQETGTFKQWEEGLLSKLASSSGGDVRRALNDLELLWYASDDTVTEADLKNCMIGSIGAFDKSGTVHYDLLSGLQKSIRGSDPDAAVFYLAKILEGGDLPGACRRLQVIASEDIGAAYPNAAAIVRACVESARELGMPEARIPLANAAILLATLPKSNSTYLAYDRARADVEAGRGQNLPPHMRPSNDFSGYLYPHDYPDHYIPQQYLPDDLVGTHYYAFGENKTEQAAKQYWDSVRAKSQKH